MQFLQLTDRPAHAYRLDRRVARVGLQASLPSIIARSSIAMFALFAVAIVGSIGPLSPCSVWGDEPSAAGGEADPAPAESGEKVRSEEGIRFFETRIRPLLAKHCYECHGEETQESDLRLDTHDGMMRGGRAGMSIAPGKPSSSLLLTAVEYQDANLKMPPEERLAAAEVADLRRWIEIGAPHPDADKSRPATNPRAVDIESGRSFWAFQTPVAPSLPAVSDEAWVRTPIDRFILAKLDEHGLRPAPAADKRTLIRRATFDLLGLPPTPDEVDAFLADESPEAFARLIDRLLESHHYGERWGRHWLDVARYADSNGLDENIAHGNAWRYRDWVIAALNEDLPFDQFLRFQIAGDLYPTDDPAERHRRLIATGYLSLGPKVLAEVDETKMEMDIIDEQIESLGRGVLGLTLGCGRCHDHKFDPFAQQDYYALAGIFKSTRTMESFTKIARWYEHPIATDDELAAKARHDEQVSAQQATIDELVASATEELKKKLGEGAALPEKPEEQFPDETKQQLAKLRDELTKLKAAAPETSTAMGVTDGDVVDVAVHIRGSHLTLGDVMPRGLPRVLVGDESQMPTFDASSSGRRQLAEWLTSADHPLTSRVFVNRVWRWHFGEGIVPSVDNFGELGSRPTNGPLLDWLATHFVSSDWSLKSLHRTIMLSNVYQMSSRHDEACAAIDPDNRFQWRANVRRLEAESVRDAMLAVSGRLDRSMGGSLLHVKNRAFLFDHTSKDDTKYDAPRRSLYLPVIRNNLYDVFQLFDYTDAGVVDGDRPTSTVAPQALFMMNGDLVLDSADALAARLLADLDESNEGGANAETDPNDNARRIERLYDTLFGRPPSDAETARALAYVQQAEVSTDVQAILGANSAPDGAEPAASADAKIGGADARDGGQTKTDSEAKTEAKTEGESKTESDDAASNSNANEQPTAAAADPRRIAWRSLCHVLLLANEFIYVR